MNPSELPHEAKIDVNETKEQFDICCSKSSVGFVKYIATYTITLAILIFSMIQIARNPEENNTIFFSLISSILTLYIPSPALPKPTN
jgi:hypothetical protein